MVQLCLVPDDLLLRIRKTVLVGAVLKKVISICFLGLVLVSALSLFVAADEKPVPNSNEAAAEVEWFAQADDAGITLAVDRVFQKKFYKALKDIHAGDYAQAGESLVGIRKLAKEFGYSNMSEYSVELVAVAQQFVDDGKLEGAAFLLNHAISLSPNHPRVNLSVASFYQLIGFRNAVAHVVTAVSNVFDYPIMFWTLILNVMLLTLVAMSLSLITVCVIQLLRGGDVLLERIMRFFPRSSRGYFGPLVWAALLITPLFLGILPALAVWAVMLSYVKKNCRWVAALAGLIIISWGAGIPFIMKVGLNTEHAINRVLEEVHNANYVPSGEKFLMAQLEQNPEDPEVLFAVAQTLHRRDLSFEAQGLYQKVTEVVSEKSPLHAMSVLNLGAINYVDGRLVDAKELFELLERRRAESFELYYNLALVHLALLDTVKHREYYNKAKSFSKRKLERFVVGREDEARVLVGSPPIVQKLLSKHLLLAQRL